MATTTEQNDFGQGLMRLARFLRRRLAAISALLFGGAVLGIGLAVPASAGTPEDCSNAHCYSMTIFSTGGDSAFNGVSLTVPLSWIESGEASADYPYHISNEIWMDLGGDASNFIEAGVADGWAEPSGPLPCNATMNGHPDCEDWVYEPGNGGSAACAQSGCGAYFLFWEDHHLVGNTVYSFMHVVRFLSPSPATDESISIRWNSAGDRNWDLNFSGAYGYSGASTQDDTVAQHPYWVEMGGELAAPAPNASCADPVTDRMGLWTGPGWTLTWPSLDPADEHISPGFNGYGTENRPDTGNYTWSMPYSYCT